MVRNEPGPKGKGDSGFPDMGLREMESTKAPAGSKQDSAFLLKGSLMPQLTESANGIPAVSVKRPLLICSGLLLYNSPAN